MQDTSKWIAVQMRDAAADGTFVYGVLTTRIYCRPNCPARLARRANVVFFADAAAAEREEFRACKRCCPREPGTMPPGRAEMRIRQLLETVDADETPAAMAARAGLSRWHFHRKFKEVTGQTPMEWQEEKKRQREAGEEEERRKEERQKEVLEKVKGALDNWEKVWERLEGLQNEEQTRREAQQKEAQKRRETRQEEEKRLKRSRDRMRRLKRIR